MKVTRKQLENLIRESVREEMGELNEEELNEFMNSLIGGIKGIFGAGAGAAKNKAQAGMSAAQRGLGAAAQGARNLAGAASDKIQQGAQAVKGAAGDVANAVSGAAKDAVNAGRGAIQVGALKQQYSAAIDALTSAITLTQKLGGNPKNASAALSFVKKMAADVEQSLSPTGKQLTESPRRKKYSR